MTIEHLSAQELAAVVLPESDPRHNDPQRFLNRELSWLQFNWRVLEEANNPAHPLLERLRFLSISASNLDEFFSVRVAGLEGQVSADVDTVSQDGLTPKQQLERIHEDAARLTQAQQEQWARLEPLLAQESVELVGSGQLSDDERVFVDDYFRDEVFKLLTPISVDLAHQFPFIVPMTVNIGVTLRSLDESKEVRNGVIPIPTQIPRFIKLPSTRGPGRPRRKLPVRFLRIETLIEMHIEKLFIGFEPVSFGAFRVLRDSDVEVEEEAEDLVRIFESVMTRRRRGSVIRLEIDSSMPGKLRKYICGELKMNANSVYRHDRLVGLSDLSKLITKDRPDLQFGPFNPRFPERIRDHDGDIFAAIRDKDFIVHHPYEAFDCVVQFLRQAVHDTAVASIKWTLYRTSNNSPIISLLKEAASAGKSVTAVIELKARFDETANLRWARDLEEAGVNVVYGFVKLKTHAKLAQVVRREHAGWRTYCHLGTGNYHPITARIYTDLSYFTADEEISEDVTQVFNFITSNSRPPPLDQLAISPHGIKTQLLRNIAAEISNQNAGRASGIWMKMNSLVDPDIIDALYRASEAGVPVDLVVRGICCLRPGVAGMSANIRVKSIVGRFLEHARIYCFAAGHALPDEDCVVYFSSADLMPRNLERRVEAMTPVTTPAVKAQVLDQIMTANLLDNVQSWVSDANGRWRRIAPDGDEPAFNAHSYFMENPSLSGRGEEALKTSTPPRIGLAVVTDEPLPESVAPVSGPASPGQLDAAE